jgi:hypothetical protein
MGDFAQQSIKGSRLTTLTQIHPQFYKLEMDFGYRQCYMK